LIVHIWNEFSIIQYWQLSVISHLEKKSGNPLKISEKGETSGKHIRKKTKRADLAEINEFPAFISNWVVLFKDIMGFKLKIK
jgi:hypothetical protein